MNFRTKHIFQEEAKGDGEGGKGSGSSDGDGDNEFTKEAFDELKKENETMKTDNLSMKSKMDELLGETKKAKTARKEAEEAARVLADKKSRDDGNFEELYHSSEQARETLQSDIDSMVLNTAKDKESSIAKTIAMELADGDNALILSDYIAKRLKFSDNEVKILDINGQLTVSTVEDLKTEFKNNSRYSSLLKGNQASGSGAPGGKSGSAAGKVLTRADFGNLDSSEKMKFTKSGGKIID